MNPNAKKQLDQELKICNSIADIFRVLGKFYDLENCKPGLITKSIMISKLQDGVKFVNAKPRKNFL